MTLKNSKKMVKESINQYDYDSDNEMFDKEYYKLDVNDVNDKIMKE